MQKNIMQKGQSSIEFLIVLVVIIIIVVLIFFELPQNTREITALGITKNHLDSFTLKSNYLGDYTLLSKVEGKDINIIVTFSLPDYNKQMLENYTSVIEKQIKNSSDFNNILISVH